MSLFIGVSKEDYEKALKEDDVSTFEKWIKDVHIDNMYDLTFRFIEKEYYRCDKIKNLLIFDPRTQPEKHKNRLLRYFISPAYDEPPSLSIPNLLEHPQVIHTAVEYEQGFVWDYIENIPEDLTKVSKRLLREKAEELNIILPKKIQQLIVDVDKVKSARKFA